jgi:hypothetical protein
MSTSGSNLPRPTHGRFKFEIDPTAIAYELEQRGLDWADKDAAARALEDSQKSVLAVITVEFRDRGKSIGESEIRARADARFQDHLQKLFDARREAARARVLFDTYRVYTELIRTQVATERALASLR